MKQYYLASLVPRCLAVQEGGWEQSYDLAVWVKIESGLIRNAYIGIHPQFYSAELALLNSKSLSQD